jgi:hypothetical protein
VLSARARELILGYLGRQGFLSGYIAASAKDGKPANTEAVMAELIETLSKAGITAETGLKSIAA